MKICSITSIDDYMDPMAMGRTYSNQDLFLQVCRGTEDAAGRITADRNWHITEE